MSNKKKTAIIVASCALLVSGIAALATFFCKKNFSGLPDEDDFDLADSL